MNIQKINYVWRVQNRHRLFSVLLSAFLLITGTQSAAQVGGISGSKISSYTVGVVNHHEVEFEPAFCHFHSKKQWDKKGILSNHSSEGDSIKWNTGLGFRVTYGIKDKLEIGTTISNNLRMASVGARYVLYDKNTNGLAVIAGANIPTGNHTLSRSFRVSDEIANAGGGLVFTAYFNPDFSVDVNAQYMKFVQKTADNGKDNFYMNSDLGYYFFSQQLQVIAGFGYQASRFNDYSSQVFTFYPGITVETGKSYIIVLYGLYDIWGRNSDKNYGMGLALTITLD